MKSTTSLSHDVLRPLRYASIVVPLAGILLAGCGGDKFAGTGNSPSNSVGTTIDMGDELPPSKPGKYGGTFTMDMITDPKTFNLWVSADNASSTAVGMLYDALITRNAYTLKYEGQLADLPKASDDGLTYTFTLKPDIKWSDGQPITADDVIFTLDVIFDEKIQTNFRESMKVDIPDGKGGYKREPYKYRKIDARTVEFKFPVAYAPAYSMMDFSIAPRHKLYAAWKEGQPAKTRFNEMWSLNVNPRELVTSGVWVLHQFVGGQRLVYKRNPNYWKKDEQGRPLPYLDTFVTLIVPDTNASTLKFRSGETDYMGIQHTDYPLIKREETKGNYTVRNLGPGWGNSYLSFNMNPKSQVAQSKPQLVKLFQDVRFRQAVSYAINRQRLCDTVFLGFAQPMYAPESPANKLFFNGDVPKYDYSMAKARQMLASMGLKDTDGNGFLEVGGRDITFNIITNVTNKPRVAMATIIVDDLKKAGIKATFTPISWSALLQRVDAKPEKGKPYPPFNWEALLLGFTGGPEPNDGRGIWQSTGNLHQWYPYQEKPATPWEAELDEIFRKGAQELDPVKRKALYDRWQVIAAEQLPLIYTVVPESLTALRNRFGNVKPSSRGLIWNIEEIYDLSATREQP